MDKLPADVTLEQRYQVEGGRDPRAHWDEIDAQVDGLKTRAD